MRVGCSFFAVTGIAAAVLVSACGSSAGPPSLTLEWKTEGASAASVLPSDSVDSVLVVRNDGGENLEAVSLRFDQEVTSQLPYGISIGTVTHMSSRFEGETQVWDLGSIEAGESVAFPMTLWFEASTRTTEPLAVRLVMLGSSPELPEDVESNVFEVAVDTRAEAGDR